MSYDMQIGAESFNYTWNVGKMWRDIYPKDGIRAHYGKTGKEASEILTVLYMAMVFRKDKLIKMNPTNGWGDYYGALEFVHKLICASLRNPDEIWSGD